MTGRHDDDWKLGMYRQPPAPPAIAAWKRWLPTLLLAAAMALIVGLVAAALAILSRHPAQ